MADEMKLVFTPPAPSQPNTAERRQMELVGDTSRTLPMQLVAECGFDNREGNPSRFFGRTISAGGAGFHSALLLTSVLPATKVRLHYLASGGPSITGIAVAPTPTLATQTVVTPGGDAGTMLVRSATISAANVPASHPDYAYLIVALTLQVVPWPRYGLELQIPMGSSLVITGADDTSLLPLIAWSEPLLA